VGTHGGQPLQSLPRTGYGGIEDLFLTSLFRLVIPELRETPGAPILIVEADCVKVESLSSKEKTLYSVVANLSLFQLVGTDSNKVPYGETTWGIEERGITFDLADIRLFLAKAVDGFLKSYRLANPKN